MGSPNLLGALVFDDDAAKGTPGKTASGNRELEILSNLSGELEALGVSLTKPKRGEGGARAYWISKNGRIGLALSRASRMSNETILMAMDFRGRPSGVQLTDLDAEWSLLSKALEKAIQSLSGKAVRWLSSSELENRISTAETTQSRD